MFFSSKIVNRGAKRATIYSNGG